MAEYLSPLVNGLLKIIKSEGYPMLKSLYDEEEKIILRDLVNAKEDSDLRIIQGRAKALKKLKDLPEQIVEKYLNDQRG